MDDWIAGSNEILGGSISASDVVYEMFPAVGIARVGNAPESFYIGPEHAGGLPILPDEPARPFSASNLRDSEGRLRRQAARFRVWRRAPGAEFEEVTLDTKDVRAIRGTVHPANKASWYRLQTSKGQRGYGPNHPLRNAERQSAEDRQRLIIDLGPRSIAGRGAGGIGVAEIASPPSRTVTSAAVRAGAHPAARTRRAGASAPPGRATARRSLPLPENRHPGRGRRGW